MRLHLKVLCEPAGVSREQMVESMQQTYSAAGIDVVVVSVETLDLPLLSDLDVGPCSAANLTAEQAELFSTNPPPDLIQSEVDTMLASPFTA